MKKSNGKKFNERKETNRNTNSRKRYTSDDRPDRRGSRGTDQDANAGMKCPHNDVSWYAKNEQLLNDAGRLPFATAIGQDFTGALTASMKDFDPLSSDHSVSYAVPGFMTLYVTPFPGINREADDPINVAANLLYAYVRHQNSGHTNYESADMIMYMMAMDSIYSFYAYLVRLYGTAMEYSGRDRYQPKGLVSGMHVNFEDITLHLADLRAYINTYAQRINSMYVPAVFTYFTRHVWMFGNIFKDSESEKAQHYMYVPTRLWKYTPIDQSTGGNVTAVPFAMPGMPAHTFESLTNIGNNLLAAALTDEDINIISGDIKKAFGDNNLYKVDVIPDIVKIQPFYSEEVGYQIQNSQPLNVTNGYTFTPTISQRNNKTYSQVFGVTTDADVATRGIHDYILSLAKNDITPADVMVSTRLIPSMDISSSGVPYLTSCGSEYVDNVRVGVYWFREDELKGIISYDVQNHIDLQTTDLVALRRDIWEQSLVSQFRFAPRRYLLGYANDETEGNDFISGVIGGLDNYTLLGSYNLEKLHYVALLTQLGINDVSGMM